MINLFKKVWSDQFRDGSLAIDFLAKFKETNSKKIEGLNTFRN